MKENFSKYLRTFENLPRNINKYTNFDIFSNIQVLKYYFGSQIPKINLYEKKQKKYFRKNN